MPFLLGWLMFFPFLVTFLILETKKYQFCCYKNEKAWPITLDARTSAKTKAGY
jgi:hypothetical protein